MRALAGLGLWLGAMACLPITPSCGNDELSQPLPSMGIIEPNLGGQGGEAGAATSQGGSAGAGQAGDAGVSAKLGDAVGGPCRSDADCPAPLTCLEPDSRALGGGPPGGLCTLSCSEEADACHPLGARCVSFGAAAYCVEPCGFGNREKCHARQDFACEPTYRKVEVSCDVDGDCAQGAVCRSGSCYLVIPVCLPRCSANDCPSDSYCDPVAGTCTSSVPSGSAVGTPCTAGETKCRGICLTPNGAREAVCTEFCRLGTPDACGSEAACLYTLDAGGTGTGDQGACAALCDCSEDCSEAERCLPLSAPLAGHSGYCNSSALDSPPISCPGGAGAAGAGG